jgi:hypothetical protein
LGIFLSFNDKPIVSYENGLQLDSAKKGGEVYNSLPLNQTCKFSAFLLSPVDDLLGYTPATCPASWL